MVFENYFYTRMNSDGELEVGFENVQSSYQRYARIAIVTEEIKSALGDKRYQKVDVHASVLYDQACTLYIVESDQVCFGENPEKWTWMSMKKVQAKLADRHDETLSIHTSGVLRAHYQITPTRSVSNTDKFSW